MKKLRFMIPAALLILPVWAETSRTSTYTYRPASPDRALVFPKDHGAHRDASYEWWYFTGHLYGEGSTEKYGFELTVFRVSPLSGPRAADAKALRPENSSYLMVHFALSDLERKRFSHTSFGIRERTGVTELSDRTLKIRVPGVGLELLPDGRTIRLQADLRMKDEAVRLGGELRSLKPVTLHGEAGFSRKGACPTCASHYSSFPRMEGGLTLNGKKYRSRVWYDHEFGSNALSEGQVGWDWFALQLKNGWDLMLFQLRNEKGEPSYTTGSFISPDGEIVKVRPDAIRLEPRGHWTSPWTQASYPERWRISVQGGPFPVEAFILPKLADQEIHSDEKGLATYWEGTSEIRTSESRDGGESLGDAYLEMTGYDSANRPKF